MKTDGGGSRMLSSGSILRDYEVIGGWQWLVIDCVVVVVGSKYTKVAEMDSNRGLFLAACDNWLILILSNYDKYNMESALCNFAFKYCSIQIYIVRYLLIKSYIQLLPH